MNLKSTALWGFVGTVVLTGMLSGAQGLGLTRMSLPFMLGSMVRRDREQATLIGSGMHLLNGWGFAVVYAAGFERLGLADWRLGTLMGLVQGVFVLTVVMPLVPSFHPRMVSQFVGPTPNRRLQPPGFMGLNYGPGTPLVALAAHALYGAVLGTFYQLS